MTRAFEQISNLFMVLPQTARGTPTWSAPPPSSRPGGARTGQNAHYFLPPFLGGKGLEPPLPPFFGGKGLLGFLAIFAPTFLARAPALPAPFPLGRPVPCTGRREGPWIRD